MLSPLLLWLTSSEKWSGVLVSLGLVATTNVVGGAGRGEEVVASSSGKLL